ncbi:prephenate dehydrogenase [Helicobacter sp. MIT 21-1697]|uniref:prephenate dehydrogenase n=1 Tax=Helicobacter sp. MIT 21-1697 TaxID=2993733 RepID=UPI00224A64F8|nr:prephenate dehydrogenase [Helicobacter sp. MIT 21-1697]MCX2717764.1 prephenate dehydrogenase [Helicobacter sp. MIT 21-1697]
MNIGIIGLGLMGGSMGLALKEVEHIQDKHINRILGYDKNALHSQQALNLGLVDECVALNEIWRCDVIFLSVPVDGIVELVSSIKPKDINENTTIIDVGGAKVQILSHIPSWLRHHFVGAHPMCGTEFFGPKAAFGELYKNNIVILTDLEQSGAYQAEIAKDIFISIGMKILKMDAHSHDKHIALISHMPHILSYALANATLAQEDPQTILALVGGGFRSMSRISKSSPLMWKDVFKQNKDNVLEAMAHFQAKFNEAKELLEREDWEGLELFMAQANTLQKFL